MAEQPTIENASAVNAWLASEGVIVAFRSEDGEFWKWFALSERDAVQLADQLRILTRTED